MLSENQAICITSSTENEERYAFLDYLQGCRDALNNTKDRYDELCKQRWE
jgi:hypothetical protein